MPGDAPTGERRAARSAPPTRRQADPGVEEYDPRPEWYFFFLFQLLRIFDKPQLLLFATIIIPTLWMILLIGWPFIDRRPRAPHLAPPDRDGLRRLDADPAAGADVERLEGAGASGEASAHPGGVSSRTHACAHCHTLADAGTARPGRARTSTARSRTTTPSLEVITNGKGGMPAFSGQA